MGHGCWQNPDGTLHTPEVGVSLEDVKALDLGLHHRTTDSLRALYDEEMAQYHRYGEGRTATGMYAYAHAAEALDEIEARGEKL